LTVLADTNEARAGGRHCTACTALLALSMEVQLRAGQAV